MPASAASPTSGWISACSASNSRARLGLGASQHRHQPRHHKHILRRPAPSRQPCLDPGVECLRLRAAALHGVDDLRRARGQVLSGSGRAGLGDHGVALDRARRVQRPPHGQVLAAVVQRVQARRVEIAAARLVADEGVVLPAVPQPEHDVDVLLGPAIARAVLHVPLAPEVQRFLLAPRGHHVPADPAFRDVVERGEEARQVVGLVVGGGGGGDEAQPLRHRGQRCQQRQRLEHVDARIVAELVLVAGAGSHRDAVRPEHEMEFRRRLGRLRHALPAAYVHRCVRRGTRHAPAAGVATGRHQVEAEHHLRAGLRAGPARVHRPNATRTAGALPGTWPASRPGMY